MDTDVAVVGGGLGGLTAATLLARAGLRTTVFERSSHFGGRATSQELGGAIFNQGPHALYRGGPAMRILSDLGIPWSGRVPSVAGNWAVRDGRLHPLPTGVWSFLTTSLLSAPGRLELIRFLSGVQVTDPSPLDSTSFSEYLERKLTRRQTRDFALALTRVTTYTNAPEVLSAGAVISQMRHALRHNVVYLDGGWQSLVEGLRDAATRSGVRLIPDAHVQSVDGDSDVKGITLTNGSAVACRFVVMAAGIHAAAHLVQSPALATWAEQAIPVHASCLDVALRRLPQPERSFALGIDRPLYFSVHSRYARLAAQDVVVVQAAKYLPPGDTGLGSRPELEALFDAMQPGWREQVVDQRYLPRMTVMNALPRADLGGLQGRPAVAIPGVKGLYLAGDSVGPVGMLADAAFASAAEAARMIVASAARAIENAKLRHEREHAMTA
jgi:phytoene dehydrogenase-like protein